MPELRGMRAVVQFPRQSAEPCAPPPTSPFMALLVEPRAIKAQARFPRCSSVCGCHRSCCSARRPRALLTQDFGDQIGDLPRFPQVKSLFQLGVPVDTQRQRKRQSPGLVSGHGSFETFCPSRGVTRDHAPRGVPSWRAGGAR